MTTTSTADICDERGDAAVVCAAPLRHYGARREFSGRVATVRCHEDNVLLRAQLEQPGLGRVLVVDGGGSFGTALIGGNVAGLGAANGWAGVVIFGAVRDVAELRETALGILALGSTPRRPGKAGAGSTGEPVTFGGATFAPGDLVVADEDGVIVLPEAP
jgi:regulator of ribonuclease activity A